MKTETDKAKIIKEILSWVFSIALAFLIATIIRSYVFEQVEIPTGSMLNTLKINERFIVNKFIYRFAPIKRHDIVVFKYPDDPSQNYVKRVIGLGGDIVEIRDGKLYVNGQEEIEPYLYEPMDPRRNFGPVTIPEDHYFMLGDNRNDSKDSRYWINKFVSRKAIKGKIVLRIFPFNRIGTVK